ncbi:S41 family peptidase [Fluviicola taffensis]|uniref:Carboxyl-terminal protease n=1 Tax=Fluviicola taffensis (strain DSM 16823 / NCIMB 13979 / RW262) TaxID=755732 RepID=F2IFW6_FLUTR|nr:S41 family peptidase [Fluviicola taffensis]AEA43587.1 carboxyl-terminal protease [Fluviicola taffensis DSM 16823]
MNRKYAFIYPTLLMIFLVIGLLIGSRLNQKEPQIVSGSYSKMQEIIGLLDREYVDSIESKKLFEKTISDMLHELDPHSNYIPSENLKAVNEQIQGKFGGVGIRFAIIRDTLCVTNVVPNSPSFLAGVKAGDKILMIDGKRITGKKIKNEDVLSKLKGDPETKVQVQIYRDRKKNSKTITRGIIPLPSIVCAQMLDNQVGYIRLDNFSISSADEFYFAAQSLKQLGMKKLIFDLRDNGGGVLDGAVRIADEFLPKGQKIVTVKGKKYLSTTEYSKGGGLLEQTELVILINENSASASEILAGAIQDNDRGTIIGRRSFGKGLVQKDFSLSDKSDLRLTIARYYTPSGRSIQKSFGESYEDYYHSNDKRRDNGEYFAPDSSVFKNAKKFKTLKGRTVYDGGGIMPDVFVPLDTTNSTYYYLALRYSGAFQQVAFDFASKNRSSWKTIQDFNANFETPKNLLQNLIKTGENLDIPYRSDDFKRSEGLIKEVMKAEIARQLFIEEGYFLVTASSDKEVQKALQILKR